MTDRPPIDEELTAWLTTAGLYSPKTFSTQDALRLAERVSANSMRMDCYCPGCKKSSTFTFRSAQKLAAGVPPTFGGNRYDTPHDRVMGYLPIAISAMTFTCARDTTHSLRFHLRSEGREHEAEFVLTKIGQFPSQFDLASGDLLRYANLLDEAGLARAEVRYGLSLSWLSRRRLYLLAPSFRAPH